MEHLPELSHISYISDVFPPVIGLYYWRRLDKSQKLVCALIYLLVAYEIINKTVFLAARQNNRILFSTYTIPEFSLIALAYSFAFTSSVARRRTHWLILAFNVFALIDIQFFLSPTDFNGLARSLETLLLVGLAMLYLRQLLDELRVQRLSRHPMFWVTVGVLLYFPGTLLLFAAYNWFSANLPKEVHNSIWPLNYVANIVFNSLIAFALWLPPETLPPPTSVPS